MQLFPAIDIMNARAVRLLYGKKENVTDYGSPLVRAQEFKEKGAKNLHIVDLDGAFEGAGRSDKIIEEIVKATGLFVQSGGGLRTIDDIKRRFDSGVSRVILGTACYKNPELLELAVSMYQDKIAAGIDAKDGFLAISGWTDKTKVTAHNFALDMKKAGIKTIIYTDISKDGALTGVNLEATAQLSDCTGLDIIASGGVKNIDDLINLKARKVYGAILGRAIYTGDIDLKKALEVINAQ